MKKGYGNYQYWFSACPAVKQPLTHTWKEKRVQEKNVLWKKKEWSGMTLLGRRTRKKSVDKCLRMLRRTWSTQFHFAKRGQWWITVRVERDAAVPLLRMHETRCAMTRYHSGNVSLRWNTGAETQLFVLPVQRGVSELWNEYPLCHQHCYHCGKLGEVLEYNSAPQYSTLTLWEDKSWK